MDNHANGLQHHHMVVMSLCPHTFGNSVLIMLSQCYANHYYSQVCYRSPHCTADNENRWSWNWCITLVYFFKLWHSGVHSQRIRSALSDFYLRPCLYLGNNYKAILLRHDSLHVTGFTMLML